MIMNLFRLVFLFLPTMVMSQDGRFAMGARNHALAGASLTLTDAWSLFNNPGALGSHKQSSLMAGYQNRFDLEGFQVIGGGVVYHHTRFNVGVKYFKFGDRYFNQQLLGLVAANRFQRVSLGGGANLLQTHTEGVNTRRVWVGEFGGTAEITSKIYLGAHIFNFHHGTQYPTTMKAGLSFRPGEALMLNTEVEKQLDQKERIKAGLEYTVIKPLLLRTGVDLQGNDHAETHVAATFGLGFKPASFIIDYAYSSQPLGAIHEIALTYQLTRNP